VKKIITIVLISISAVCSCQDAIHSFKSFIKTTPFAIYDSENPSFRIAYELKFSEKFGLQVGAGWIYTLYDYKERSETESANFGYVLNAELRNYLPTNKGSNGLAFWGLRGVVINSDNTRKMMFSPESQIYGSPDSFEELVRVQKQILGVQLILGGKFTVTKHLFLEGIIGLGSSYRRINNNTPESYSYPVFDRNIRSQISNRNYNNWFTPYPYFQIHVGFGW